MASLSSLPADPDTAPDRADTAAPEDAAIPFTPATLRARHDGWTAARQRVFVDTLAESGCVREAAGAAGMSARSAYRLRARPDGLDFARAWDAALRLASARLVALALDRVIHGMREEVWKDGELVAERVRPSERLHIFLLTHLAPMQFGQLAGFHPYDVRDPVELAREQLADLSEDLEDIPPDIVEPDPLPYGSVVIDWQAGPTA